MAYNVTLYSAESIAKWGEYINGVAYPVAGESPQAAAQRRILFSSGVVGAISGYVRKPDHVVDAFIETSEVTGTTNVNSLFLTLLGYPNVRAAAEQGLSGQPWDYWWKQGNLRSASDEGEIFYNPETDTFCYFRPATVEQLAAGPAPPLTQGYGAFLQAKADAVASADLQNKSAAVTAVIIHPFAEPMPANWASGFHMVGKIVQWIGKAMVIENPVMGLAITGVGIGIEYTPDLWNMLGDWLDPGTIQTPSAVPDGGTPDAGTAGPAVAIGEESGGGPGGGVHRRLRNDTWRREERLEEAGVSCSHRL